MFKNRRLLICFLLVGTMAYAQLPSTVIMQPNANEGIDAMVLNRTDMINGNFGTDPSLFVDGWTGSSHNSVHNDGRSFIRFSQLDLLPNREDFDLSAKLVLYSTAVRRFSSSGDNKGKIFLVNKNWSENTVTWNTQPTYNASPSVATPVIDQYFDSVVIDVSVLVQKIVSHQVPNYGFLYKLDSEDPYRSIEFASSDYATPKRRPKLVVGFAKKGTYVSIPDPKFKAALLALGVDKNFNSQIEAEEALLVDKLVIKNKGIVNLQGIASFTNLTYLDCSGNRLAHLYVNKNTKLKYLYCDDNVLDILTLYANTPANALLYVSCSNNLLPTLDVSKVPNLSSLNCSSNKLPALDVSKNGKLKYLSCYKNEINALDVSQNTALVSLSCKLNGMNQLTFGNQAQLEKVYCDFNRLTKLNLASLTGLQSLIVNNNLLDSLDLSKNAALSSFEGTSNSIDDIYITSLQSAKTPSWKKDAATRWHIVDDPRPVVSFPDPNFKAALLAAGVDKDQDGSIQYSEAAEAEKVDVSDANISSLGGIEHFTSLKELYCHFNPLTSLDLSANGSLKVLFFYYTQISQLDVSHNPALEQVVGYSSPLQHIDLSQNPALKLIYLDDTFLDSLDLSHNTLLETVYLNHTTLKKLDLRNNVALKTLNCYNGVLETLLVGYNTRLENLICFNNQLSSLDASHLTTLFELVVFGNQLTHLDVSHNDSISYLGCEANPLLTQICVSQYMLDNQVASWTKDPEATFEVCSAPAARKGDDGEEESTVLSLYPNPAHGYLYVVSSQEVSSIRIKDTHGAERLSSKGQKIDISFLPAGIYVAEITTEQGTTSKKIVVE